MSENMRGERGNYNLGPMYAFTYDRGDGKPTKRQVGGKELAQLYGYGILDLLLRSGFSRLIVQYGHRKALITPWEGI